MTRGRGARRTLAYGPRGGRSVAELVNDKMVACMQAVEGQTTRETMKRVGIEGKKIVRRQLVKDVGADEAMSNWRRSKPVPLRVWFEQPSDNMIVLEPSRYGRGRGIWRTLEDGRRAGTRGRYRRRATRSRQRPIRWGASRGKQTWSRSMAEFESKGSDLYRRVQRDKVVDAFKKG